MKLTPEAIAGVYRGKITKWNAAPVGYAPLPESVAAKEQQALGRVITEDSKPLR